MDFESNMIVRDTKDGSLWLLQGGFRGQYNVGWVWTALRVIGKNGDGTYDIGPDRQHIDSASNAYKFEFFQMTRPETTWYYDHEKTEKVEKLMMDKALSEVLGKLSPKEQELLAQHYQRRG